MKNTIISRSSGYLKKNMGNISTPNELEHQKSRLFKKYFPKYLKEFSPLPQNYGDPITDPKVFLKTLKRTKILYKPSSSFIFHPKWKPFFANKRKCIKHIQHDYPQPLQKLIKRVKYFSTLESLSLYMPVWSQKIERENKTCIMIVLKLTKLKKLELTGLTESHKIFIEKLDSSPRFLSSLEELRLVCASHLSENTILGVIRKNKTLLEFTTSFVPNPLGGVSYGKSFQMLGRCFPRLENLKVHFSYGCYKGINYLGAIGIFKNLKAIDFYVGDVNIFVRDFIVPDSLKDLRFFFGGDGISNIQVDNMDSLTKLKINKGVKIPQFFEENKLMLRFYENFEGLKGLENLEMKFRFTTDPIDYQCLIHFSEHLLRRTSSLKSLILLPPWSSREREGNYSPFQLSLKESHLPKILSSLKGSSETLEKLEVGHDRIVFSNLDFEGCHGMFKKLGSVKITGKLEDYGMNGQIERLLDEVIKLGEEVKLIKLSTVTENKIESLLSVLRQVRKLKRPEKVKIELEVRFLKGNNLEGVDFESVVEELKRDDLKLKGVSLTIFTKASSEPMGEFLRMYGEKFDGFQNLPTFL